MSRRSYIAVRDPQSVSRDANVSNIVNPVDAGELLRKVNLTVGQVAAMTGLSVRQISYWTSKGIISATNPKKRIYGYAAVEKALLIKRGLDDGLSLAEAVDEAEERLRQRREDHSQLGRLNHGSTASYLMSRLGDLDELADKLRQQIQTLDHNGRDRERRLAVTKLEVVDLLAQNPYTRDTASRIATRLGRAIDLVSMALDELAEERAVEKVRQGDRIICQLPTRDRRTHE